MALERRLARIEAARVAQPHPDADAAFAALCTWLDDTAGRAAQGDPEAHADLDAFRRMVKR